MGAVRFLPLFDTCPCGEMPVKAGLCKSCYARRWRSMRRFGGNREAVLERDDRLCRACGSSAWPVVHHRNGSDEPANLITLCAGCHAVVHHLKFNRRWLPEPLVELWRERRNNSAFQLQLALSLPDGFVVGTRMYRRLRRHT